VFREFLLRAMMFHKNYCSDLVYIAEPLVRVTEGSHNMLLVYVDLEYRKHTSYYLLYYAQQRNPIRK
ncbi:MAG: hypothetical protein ACFFEW_16790, partial [Candidatus Thorarchaeota archaeon]